MLHWGMQTLSHAERRIKEEHGSWGEVVVGFEIIFLPCTQGGGLQGSSCCCASDPGYMCRLPYC